MSKEQYDLTTKTDYLNNKMFLDPSGPVTIQRFEEVKYDKIARGPVQVFTPVVSLPELEALMYNWSFFETNIHSRSYSHIIRNIYNVPKDIFDTIHNTKEIADMASSVCDYYDGLHVINCQKEMALRFMVSFATSLAMVENRIFMGNGNIISLILQDELLHKGWTGWIIKQVVKEDERFAKAQKECEQEVYDMYMDVIREEKEWADYLFKKGPVIGLNANILKEFVDYTALESLKAIGIKYNEPAPKVSPIPWFNKHSDTSKKQTALQENESTNYVIGVMSESLDYDDLPELA